MDRLTTIALQVGEWRIDPQLGQMTRGTDNVRLDARALRLLMYLANRAGETVSIEELLDQVWSGVVVTQDSVYQAVTALRRLLGDDARQPKYIVTVPRLGYRLIAPVRAAADEPPLPAPVTEAVPHRRLATRIAAALALLVFVLVLGVVAWRAGTNPSAQSLAVLPFLDLTSQSMDEEYFADGMTEALIDRLSSEPGFKVPSASASYFYKHKALPPAEIARELRVRYLLEGSLRESDETLRITARLTRASDNYVVWTQTYERPKSARARIQDEIAEEVAVALRASVR